MSARKVLVVIPVVMLNAVALADGIWPPPSAWECRSINGRYGACVTPAKDGRKPHLAVFEVQDRRRIQLWQCDLGNELFPVNVAISDDGQYVATCNEWCKVGYGDFVLAFYGKEGLVKHYSLEQILPQDRNASRLSDLMPHSTGSRRWDQNSIKLFDTQAARPCFGIWVPLVDRWIVWDASSGEGIPLGQDEVAKWNAKARSWVIGRIQSRGTDAAACAFLVKLRRPGDRTLLEALLSNSRFTASSMIVSRARSSASPGTRVTRLRRDYCYSAERLMGDQSLAKWDGKVGPKNVPACQTLHYLGIVEGTVTLPQEDDLDKAQLWIYLVPADVPNDRWAEKPLVHRMNVGLTHLRFAVDDTRAFQFGISTVTPGRYWIKIVLDKAGVTAGQYRLKAMLGKTGPLSAAIYVPQTGDYENMDSPIITVVAGRTENVSVDCTHKVTDGAD